MNPTTRNQSQSTKQNYTSYKRSIVINRSIINEGKRAIETRDSKRRSPNRSGITRKKPATPPQKHHRSQKPDSSAEMNASHQSQKPTIQLQGDRCIPESVPDERENKPPETIGDKNMTPTLSLKDF
ncbi:hypothetical protein DY000_02036161 [Brassica cretica]|uniref:Uncharacterized protein n=1 Tax=Brassica cretica TaxID=69181 RepID=A0ABQ7BGI9_BRACR|nr:hypothetical protein DY000_02036161 [Brassica cretica]